MASTHECSSFFQCGPKASYTTMTTSCYLCNGESTRGCVLIFNTVKAAQAVNISKILSLYCTIADSCCIIFRLFCFLWCDGLLGSLQAGLATQRRLRSDQLPQDSCKTGSDLFRGKKKPSFVKLLSPGAQCPDHLWRPDRLDGTWPLALQEGDAHMEDMGEKKTLVHINVHNSRCSKPSTDLQLLPSPPLCWRRGTVST